MITTEQKNNINFGEFYAISDGEKAGLLQYDWVNELTFNIKHTEVDPNFEGKGIGKHLVTAALEFARKDNRKITATCPFASAVLEKDPTAGDVFIP